MIYIFSQSIRSGKTTVLQEWISGKKNIAGILTPDINGKRKLLDIANQEYYDLQLENDNDDGIKIGRFVFDKKVFQKANELLLDAKEKDYDWLIVDEVGRLEMDEHLGVSKAVNELIIYHKSKEGKGNLLLIIRDYLLDKAIDHYSLQDAKIISKDFFLDNNNLTGMVLCGGESSRMKQNKALIAYHDTPQYLHLAKMLQQFCNTVIINSNIDLTGDSYELLKDDTEYALHGPISGLLTVMKKYPTQDIFVVACDYPYFKRIDLLHLSTELSENVDVICFENMEGYYEPLIAIYKQSSFQKLKSFFEEGNDSLQQFLKKVNTLTINPSDARSLISFDTNDQRNNFDKEKYIEK